VEHQGGKQADDPLRHPDGNLGQAVVFGHVVSGDGIDPVTEAGDRSVGQRRFERGARHPEAGQITGPDDRLPTEQRLEPGIVGVSHD
jgi:hypothetical protein